MTAATMHEPQGRHQTRIAAASGWIGSALEYYDFFIYATAASLIFPQIFFPSANPTVAIVASQGRYDEAALEVLLPRDVGFIGLLASRRRAAQIRGILAQGGVEAAALTRLRNPVGIDIGARTPGDVAVSILAAIVADARERARSERDAEPAPAELDPVCGMEVDGTALSLEHRGRRYAFCSAHCRQTFLADPGRFAAAGSR